MRGVRTCTALLFFLTGIALVVFACGSDDLGSAPSDGVSSGAGGAESPPISDSEGGSDEIGSFDLQRQVIVNSTIVLEAEVLRPVYLEIGQLTRAAGLTALGARILPGRAKKVEERLIATPLRLSP